MELGIVAGSGVATIAAEKTTETAIVAKTAERVAASASLSSKIGAVAEKAVRDIPKMMISSASVEAVNNLAKEIDSSLADTVKIAGSVYNIVNSATVLTGMEKSILAVASEVVKDDTELSTMVQVTRYAKSTVSCLRTRINEVVDKAKEGIDGEEKAKDVNVIDSIPDTFEPNSIIEIGGRMYDTDDNGNIFKVDGYELLPNKEYEINGVTYTTDDLGRITSCKGLAKLSPENGRDNIAQKLAGGSDRKEGDEGGHILARILGGSPGIENMMALRGYAINHSVYGRMESEIRKFLESQNEVSISFKIEYKGDSQRPSKITVMYTIDGKERVVQFDNDEGSTELLTGLENKIDEGDFNDLDQEILDAKEDGVTISIISVKTIYDESGKAEKIIVTMRDESSEHPVNEDRVFSTKEVE